MREQFFSANSLLEHATFWWYGDNVCFVIDQLA